VVVPLAVGATASDHLEFLWRVVNQFPKVREVDSTASDHPEPVPVAFPVVLWVFERQIAVVQQLFYPKHSAYQVEIATVESDPLLFEC
jgi:hypothetical protein